MTELTDFDAGRLAADFVTLHDLLLRDDPDGSTFLRRLTELAVDVIPGCDSATITRWPTGREPYSLAATGEALAADRLQYATGEGPCLAAADAAELTRIADVGTENRWPAFCSALAAHTSFRTVLSFHLGDTPERTALNLYGDQPGDFDESAVGVGAIFAAHARVLLAHAASSNTVAQLRAALTTSRQIGAAVGVLMGIHKISEDQAFGLLRESSQRLNRKLRDIAADVTRSGVLPSAGAATRTGDAVRDGRTRPRSPRPQSL